MPPVAATREAGDDVDAGAAVETGRRGTVVDVLIADAPLPAGAAPAAERAGEHRLAAQCGRRRARRRLARQHQALAPRAPETRDARARVRQVTVDARRAVQTRVSRTVVHAGVAPVAGPARQAVAPVRVPHVAAERVPATRSAAADVVAVATDSHRNVPRRHPVASLGGADVVDCDVVKTNVSNAALVVAKHGRSFTCIDQREIKTVRLI